jgi:hypothetical protein
MEAYPLKWPQAWPRTEYPIQARFKVSMSECIQDLYDELDRLGATNIVVSSNMRLRLDGRPLASQQRMDDEGVVVYFTYNGAQQCIPCDKWDTVKDNVRAIGLTVGALRGLERWGAKEMVTAAFQGFKALPAPNIPSAEQTRAWHEVLQVTPDADINVVRAAYRNLAAKYHPDNQTTGNTSKFAEVATAWEEAQKQAN